MDGEAADEGYKIYSLSASYGYMLNFIRVLQWIHTFSWCRASVSSEESELTSLGSQMNPTEIENLLLFQSFHDCLPLSFLQVIRGLRSL